MTAWRIGLAICGLAAAAYGLVLVLQTGWANIAHALPWLVGGVVAHDAVLAPATILVAFVSAQLVPAWLRGPATVGAVVLVSLTLLAIPVLGRFGARADNPTLLDRDYRVGWIVVAAVTVCSVAVGAALRRRVLRSAARTEAGADGR